MFTIFTSVNENSPRWVAIPVPVVVTVIVLGEGPGESTSRPCIEPLKGTWSPAVAGMAIAAVRIIAAIGRQIVDLFKAFILRLSYMPPQGVVRMIIYPKNPD
jgi:hypothetical protein